ncbi:MAG: molybdenum cofactor biosynthesis protein MoaE [Armatimonadetes bacterium]|nr:molybdenum cofactor biosynthesis protein MoaE [Armatimonadota bacterium]
MAGRPTGCRAVSVRSHLWLRRCVKKTGVENAVQIEITPSPLSLEPLLAFVQRRGYGGVVTFTGNVRDYNHGRRVLYLEYDAYRPMAEREMRAIAEEAVRRWDCCIAMAHRIGRLEVGEASVMIAVACAHRAPAFEACRYAIDTLKEAVPIWKKEAWEGGEVWIEGGQDA